VLSTVYLQPGAVNLLPGAVLDELSRDPAAALVAPLGFGDSFQGHPVVGTTAAFAAHLAGGELAQGRMFARIGEAVAGAAFPSRLGETIVPAHGQVETEEAEDHHASAYHIVGRLPRLGNPWDAALIVPIEAVWAIHALPFGHAGVDLERTPLGPPWDAAELPGMPAIVVKPTSFAAAYQLRARYRARTDTTALFPAEVLVQLYRLLGDVRDLLAIISVLTQMLVIGAVLLAVLASLSQRRRLIAVLRALGAPRLYIFATIWLGVAFLLTLAGILGLGLGYLSALVLSTVFASRTGVALPVALAASEVWLVLAIIGIGLLLATIPAALAYRGSVGAALRA
jgi:putative ABC transport system permease protein